MEDAVLAHLYALAARPAQPLDPAHVEAALTAAPTALGPDQAAAVRTLCGEGAALRALVAPAGPRQYHYGRPRGGRRPGRGPAGGGGPHPQGGGRVALRGVEPHTVVRLRLPLSEATLAPGSVLVVDEVSSSPPATRRSSWPPWPPPPARPCGA